MLNNGAAINDMGGAHCDGVTPLIDAATNGHVDIVKLLVEEGANILLKDSHVSCDDAFVTVWQFLLSKD